LGTILRQHTDKEGVRVIDRGRKGGGRVEARNSSEAYSSGGRMDGEVLGNWTR